MPLRAKDGERRRVGKSSSHRNQQKRALKETEDPDTSISDVTCRCVVAERDTDCSCM
jgi:hypothetical protein